MKAATCAGGLEARLAAPLRLLLALLVALVLLVSAAGTVTMGGVRSLSLAAASGRLLPGVGGKGPIGGGKGSKSEKSVLLELDDIFFFLVNTMNNYPLQKVKTTCPNTRV